VSAQEEADHLDRGLAALEEVAGVRPVGYRAPMWDLSWRSPALLAERGFLYDSSLMDADAPYELATAAGSASSLVEIPIQWALDDWEQYCYLPDISGTGLIETPRKARELWQGEFEGLRSVGGCWVLTNHPFLTGRPSRAQQLDELMAHVVSCTDVWTASLEEIAVHVRSLRLEPRSVEYPADLP
jgi:peptidoglycan-N-acetylglucosamine deacetylase